MKKAGIVFILCGLSLITGVFAIYRSFKSSDLVYVDVNRLIEGYNRTKLAKQEFENKAKVMKGNIDSLVGNWQKELSAFEKERATLSVKELELKKELLSNKQQQLNSYQEAIQKQIQDEDKKITQTVINEINEYVKEYGNNHNYKIIFGASGGGNIMYANESSDLTEKVLEGLNDEYGKK